MTVSITLPCVPEYVAVVRAVAKPLFAAVERDYEAAQIVSELAGNSTRHSRSRHGGKMEVRFRLDLDEHAGRIEVVDAGPDALPVPRAEADEHGRGLLELVDAFAEKWGHDVADGKHVWWAELSW